MNLDAKKTDTGFIKWNSKWFKVIFDDTFKCGDIVRFVNDSEQTLAYGYLNSNIYYKDDLPYCRITLQNEARTFEVIVTNALQRI